MAANKVKFGLCNVHYALVTETVTSGVTTTAYGTVKALPGAVNLSLSSSASKSVFRKCSASRPSIASATTGEGGSTDPQTESITITAGPRGDADKLVHAWTQDTTDSAVIEAWYTAVPVPTFTP